MHKLALFTPWPPQHSGIADYAFDLAIGLAHQGVHVSVFTDATDPIEAGERITVLPAVEFSGADNFDRVIFQMGNNLRFHSSMMIPLAKYGGIVHLHDMVLHHMVHDLTSGHGQGRLYYRLLKHWYGSEVFEQARAWKKNRDDLFAHSEGVTDIPLFEPILRYANGCIVHSHFCRQHIQKRLPHLPCEVIPQTYRNAVITERERGDVLRVGMFGSVNPSKHADQVLWAMKSVLDHGAAIHLDIAGNLDCGGKRIYALVDQLGMRQHVTFHGRVNEGAFQQIMRSVDLCVSLRYPTMGETSGVVSRSLQTGIPIVVNDVGWYAELPSCVAKLSVNQETMQRQLAELLSQHAFDRQFHDRIRRGSVEYARDEIDFNRVNQRYLAMTAKFPQAAPVRADLAEAAA